MRIFFVFVMKRNMLITTHSYHSYWVMSINSLREKILSKYCKRRNEKREEVLAFFPLRQFYHL